MLISPLLSSSYSKKSDGLMFHSSLMMSNITIGNNFSKNITTLEGNSTFRSGKWIAIYRELIITMKCSIEFDPEAPRLNKSKIQNTT